MAVRRPVPMTVVAGDLNTFGPPGLQLWRRLGAAASEPGWLTSRARSDARTDRAEAGRDISRQSFRRVLARGRSTSERQITSPCSSTPSFRAVLRVARHLVVMHIDGLGADSLEEALREGDMPFTKHLIDDEGYAVHRYRCGVPVDNPFVQAGILYATTPRYQASAGGTASAVSSCSLAPVVVQEGGGQYFHAAGR